MRNRNTGIRFSRKFISASMTHAVGTAIRGKSILRTRFSRMTTDWTDDAVESVKNWKITTPSSIATPNSGWFPPTLRISANTM